MFAHEPRVTRRHRRFSISASLVIGVMSIVLALLAGCGGGGDDESSATQPSDTGTSTPATGAAAAVEGVPAEVKDALEWSFSPECDSQDCFVPAPPEEGTEIPQATMNFGLRPYADNSFYIIGIEKGWYEDAGLTLNPVETSENAIALMLNGQVDLNAMYGPTLVPTMKDQDALKMVMFTDDFVGYRILANPELGLKTVNDYMDEGLEFEEALKQALQPVVDSGEQLATAPLVDTRPFIKIAFDLAGFDQPKLLVIEDSRTVQLARAGDLNFATPTGAPQTLQLLRDGWTPLVSVGDILENVPGFIDSPVEQLVGTVGVAGNKTYINGEPNSVLRFVGTTFRLLDAMVADPSILDIQVPYLNAFAGTDLTAEDLQEVYTLLDPLSPWDTQGRYFEEEDNALYYKTAYQSHINAFTEQGLLPEGNEFVADDLIWAGQIYFTLKDYQNRADVLLNWLNQQQLSENQTTLVDQARQFYEWYNFLDAYRLARQAVVETTT